MDDPSDRENPFMTCVLGRIASNVDETTGIAFGVIGGHLGVTLSSLVSSRCWRFWSVLALLVSAGASRRCWRFSSMTQVSVSTVHRVPPPVSTVSARRGPLQPGNHRQSHVSITCINHHKGDACDLLSSSRPLVLSSSRPLVLGDPLRKRGRPLPLGPISHSTFGYFPLYPRPTMAQYVGNQFNDSDVDKLVRYRPWYPRTKGST